MQAKHPIFRVANLINVITNLVQSFMANANALMHQVRSAIYNTVNERIINALCWRCC